MEVCREMVRLEFPMLGLGVPISKVVVLVVSISNTNLHFSKCFWPYQIGPNKNPVDDGRMRCGDAKVKLFLNAQICTLHLGQYQARPLLV